VQAPPPVPSDGSVASDPLEAVDLRPVAVMAGTYRRKKGRRGNDSDHAGRLGSGRLTQIDPAGRIGLADSDQAG
jgi:hypothetical protein